METLGTRIRHLRQATGLTVSQAAWLAGWPRQRWHDLEMDRARDPRWSTIQTVADVLGVDFVCFLTRENNFLRSFHGRM